MRRAKDRPLTLDELMEVLSHYRLTEEGRAVYDDLKRQEREEFEQLFNVWS